MAFQVIAKIVKCYLKILESFYTTTGNFRRFSTRVWQNACVNTVRRAMVYYVYFIKGILSKDFIKGILLTLLKGLCAYTWYF